MADESILNHIEKLVAEEHELQSSERSDANSDEALERDRERLEQVQIELDQAWDLLRQRRARRESGENPDEAHVRDPDTVERYWQ
jgi:hypothetical protein